MSRKISTNAGVITAFLQQKPMSAEHHRRLGKILRLEAWPHELYSLLHGARVDIFQFHRHRFFSNKGFYSEIESGALIRS